MRTIKIGKDNFIFRCKRTSKKSGFTLIEFLVVIAIIGALSTIVIINVNNSAGKANRAAFIDEVAGSIPGILTRCVGNADIGTLSQTTNVTWGAPISQACGQGSAVTFCVPATNRNDFVSTAAGGCTVSVNDSGKVFFGNNCSSLLTNNNCQ